MGLCWAAGPLRKSYASLQMQADDTEPPVVASGDDNLYIMYTSGTTGFAQGVIHSHSTAIWACITQGATADTRFQDRYMGMLPLFHVGALTPITGCVYLGCTSIILRAFDPTLAWHLIEQEKVTSLLAVPAMANAMLQSARERRGGLLKPPLDHEWGCPRSRDTHRSV